MTTPARDKGFTLIELLIVVSIIIILSGALLPSFVTYISNQTLKQAQEQVRNDLRSVQNNALAGTSADEIVDGDKVQYWGVKFDADSPSYVVFISDSNTNPDCNTPGPTKNTYKLTGDTFVKTGGCVFFDMKNGNISSSPTTLTQVIVGYEDDSACLGVTLSKFGMIQNSTAACP